jgi:hypothetical protein
MSLKLTVHRGTQQIGGSCIEIAHLDGARLILDAGRPLDAPEGATGLLRHHLIGASQLPFSSATHTRTIGG